MRAAQPLSGDLLRNKYFGKRTIRPCATSAKGDNIVLIEVDTDDFGDVIILDVPESLQEKFKKNREHRVISIDDDDDDDDEENRAGKCHMADGATSSNSFSSASDTRPSHRANVNESGPFVGEGSNPVKLSKSKRTYSGQGISRNLYGLDPGFEGCSSESDDSDCELVEDSLGKLREEWEKASFKRRHEASVQSDTEDKASPSASNFPDHNSAEEGTADHLKPTNSPSNLGSVKQYSDSQKFAEGNDCSQKDSDTEEMAGLFTRKHGRYHESSDTENNVGTTESDQPLQDTTGPNTPEHSEQPEDNCCFKIYHVNHERNYISSDIPETVAKPSEGSVHVSQAEVSAKTSTGNLSDGVTNRIANEGVENENLAFNDGEQNAQGHAIALNNSSGSPFTELKSSSDHNDMIIDRQKLKETDEYRRAMEEEWASRQQQLQRQAEEAQRLRSRKRAETMRVMANERRQRLRLEEVRETRRKDEENSNLKDKLRAEIRNELRKLEIRCPDMASLLRALGIHVGGGFCPPPNEVQVAYKKACLKFHPDRLSGRDLRQQVEAEEKFKLISNMKDKF